MRRIVGAVLLLTSADAAAQRAAADGPVCVFEYGNESFLATHRLEVYVLDDAGYDGTLRPEVAAGGYCLKKNATNVAFSMFAKDFELHEQENS